MSTIRTFLAFLFLFLVGHTKAEEVVENDQAVAEVCDEDEPFTAATCLKYQDIVYESDNRNPTPQWIKKPIPKMKRLILRRMRKGGSTTLEKFVQKSRQLHQKISLSPLDTIAMNAEHEDNAFIGYDAMEYESLNMQCFFGSSAILGPESKAILVTHFRKPIDRINSEYWSEGPGNTLHISEESTWKDWFAASEMRHQSIGSGYEPGIYTDNYYVRILTGNCGDCHLRTVKKPHATDIGMVQGCKGSSHYYPYAKMNMALYCKAIEIAEHFQIIVITEYFDKPAMNIWLRREMEKLMHMPKGGLDQLSLGHERNHKDSKNAQSFQSSPPASIVKHLEQENKYDIELYEWAKTKVDALIAPFE